MKGLLKVKYLLPIVAVIWAIIGFQINAAISNNTISANTPQFETSIPPLLKKNRDSFSVNTFNRDPFLGHIKKDKRQNKVNISKNKTTKKVNKPNIFYKGIIKNKKSNQVIFVVEIGKKQYLFKKNQTINNVKIVKGNELEVTIILDGKRTKIKKE